MKKIEWNTKKRWKVVQILCLMAIWYIIWSRPHTMPGAEYVLFPCLVACVSVIYFNISDILKSKEKEKEELTLGLKNMIELREKEIEELKKRLEKLG